MTDRRKRPRTLLRELLRPAVTASGLDLEDVEVTPAGRRTVVRVLVDRDGGVDLDAVTEVSRAVSAVLDEADGTATGLGDTPYVLEVGSPGVDRALVEPRHWRRARGRLVRASLRGGEDVLGRVGAVEDDGVHLDVGGAARVIEWSEIARGQVQVEFSGPGGDGATREEG